MTWVVAGEHLGCVRCLADIQVTLKYPSGEKKYVDAVQKVHAVRDGVVIAFAGSIKLAFDILEEVKTKSVKNIKEELFAAPAEVARKLQRAIKHYYRKLNQPKNEKVEFLILIAPHGTFKGFGLYKIVSPAFIIVEPNLPFQIMQIGSGSKVETYKEIIRKHDKGVYIVEDSSDPDGEPTLIIPTGKSALQYLFAEAVEYQNAGISQSMHICRLLYNQTYIEPLLFDLKAGFPVVATSWQMLVKILGDKGIKVGECTAYAIQE
jgi:ATP-dependent protease HslVU (ClpYQ) peptidase subunit